MLGCGRYEYVNRSMATMFACLINSQAVFEMDKLASVLTPLVSKVKVEQVPQEYEQSYSDSIKVCFWVSKLLWPISVIFGDRTV